MVDAICAFPPSFTADGKSLAADPDKLNLQCLRLSAFAAETLINANKVDLKELDIHSTAFDYNDYESALTSISSAHRDEGI